MLVHLLLCLQLCHTSLLTNQKGAWVFSEMHDMMYMLQTDLQPLDCFKAIQTDLKPASPF